MRPFRLALFPVLMFLIGSLSSSAATWHVPSECPTIQAGVDSAAVGDTVRVACDTYYEHDIIMKSGVCLTSETGESGCVTIDAQRMGRVIYCLDVDDAASIVGFTITGGLATGTAVQDSVGGGIYCEDSSPTLANCTLLENDAALAGGGLFCGMDVSTSLTNRTLWRGGDALPPVRSGPTVTDCTFSGNSSPGGGGAFCYQYSPTLTRCMFSGNSAELGGAMYCATDGTSFVDCTFFGNQADVSAGALYFSAWSSATVTDCAFLHNTSARHGGAVRSEQSASPTFSGVTFTRNVSVWSGGAVLCEDGSPSFDHVEFSTNTAGGAGGGIRCGLSASATITNATFYDNVAAHGSGLYCGDSSSATLANCIIAFGGETTSAVQCGGTASIVISASDVYGNGGGDWVDCIAGQGSVTGNFSADPLFCSAELGDLSLNEDSPCLPGNHPDGGDWGLIGDWGVGCPATGIAENAHETSWGMIKEMFR
ncbi:MAG: right-handed parallel beta-helix repeat-containing protein [Candidatus Eisenbacteria bacterium]|nr:right-handed parallel beta-helix repeat-containing protein [Candidatus Eisenbacteria bacterium]